jgi:hypothetical protein
VTRRHSNSDVEEVKDIVTCPDNEYADLNCKVRKTRNGTVGGAHDGFGSPNMSRDSDVGFMVIDTDMAVWQDGRRRMVKL